MDVVSPERRSEIMSQIRSKGTAPEMTVRRLLYSLGYRYRLHAKDLPGKPDIVFRGRRKAIFVHGCFWHQHDDPNCKIARVPKSRKDYWEPKLKRNVERDRKAIKELEAMGWDVLIIWECELRAWDELVDKISKFMSS